VVGSLEGSTSNAMNYGDAERSWQVDAEFVAEVWRTTLTLAHDRGANVPAYVEHPP
jgi:hypothetical protein